MVGICVPNFFGHAKFEVKSFHNFFLYHVIWTLNFLGRRGSRHQLFLVTLNFRSKSFRSFSFIECSGLWICQLSGQQFFGHAKLEDKKFSEFFPLPRTLDWISQRGVWAPPFLVMLNLKSGSFQNFFTYRALWTLKFMGGGWGSGHQLFLVMLNLRSKIFHNFFIYKHSGLWICQVGAGVRAPTFLWC